MSLRPVLGLFKKSFDRWYDDDCLRLGAALAYYTLFSIFPLALLCMTAVGIFLGEGDETRMRILGLLHLPPAGAAVLNDTLVAMQRHQSAGGMGAVAGFALLFLGASAVFSELDFAFNRFWRVPVPTSQSFWKNVLDFLRTKLAALALVALAGAFVLASLIIGTVLGAIQSYVSYILPFAWAWDLIETGVSTALLTLTFAALFRVLPDTDVAWRDVGWGAFLTTFLVTLSKRGVAWYLAHLASFAAYGAVGGVLALVTWMYVTSLIIYFGGEFSRVYAEERGSLRPALTNRARDHVDHERDAPDDRAHAHVLPKPPVGR